MIEAGKELFRSSSPTPLLTQSQLEQTAQDPAQSGGDSTTSLGNLFQCFTILALTTQPNVAFVLVIKYFNKRKGKNSTSREKKKKLQVLHTNL